MVSATRAAALLGVTTRSVRSYVRRGVLRGARGQVDPGDVLVLDRERKHRARHVVDRVAFRLALAQVESLEVRLAPITQVLNLRGGELGRNELISMYQAAQIFVEQGWPPNSAATWAMIFSRLRLSSLAILKRATRGLQPWRPFYRLFIALEPEMQCECGAMATATVGAHLTKLATAWLEKTIGARALHAAIRAAGGEPDRLLAREMWRGRRQPA